MPVQGGDPLSGFRGWSPRKNRAVNVGLALFFSIVPFALLEMGARLVLPPIPANFPPTLSANEIEDDQLIWRHRPGYGGEGEEGPINTHGFRGADFPLAKPPGTFRVLSLGESTTYGHGVDWRHTYSHMLEQQLQYEGYPVQVINAGVRAWSTFQSLRFLELEIDRLQPDVVLFYHEINDYLPTTWRGLEMDGVGLNDIEVAQLMQERRWLLWLVRQSRLLTEVQLVWARAQATEADRRIAEMQASDVLRHSAMPYEFVAPTPDDPKPWMENDARNVRLPDPERESSLRRLIELTRNRGAQLVLIHPAYPVSKAHRCLLTRLAREERVPLVDVEDLFSSYAGALSVKNRKGFFLPDDYFHLNHQGHAVLAVGLRELLVGQNLVR